MKAKRKLLLGIGLVVVPISLATVATACSTDGNKKNTPDTTAEKTVVNNELKKVTLDFSTKASTLASTITANTTFTEGGFDKNKYDLKITRVEVGSDKTSVVVTFHLIYKESKANPKTVSDNRALTITGFKKDTSPAPKPTPGGGGSVTPQKKEADEELKKVRLTFNNAASTLASSVTNTSAFTESGYDTQKYELKVTSVAVGADKTSVTVTFHLVSKNTTGTAVVSSESTVTISGFKTPTPPQKPDQKVDPKITENINHLNKFAAESLKNITINDVFGNSDLKSFFTAAASELVKPKPDIKIDGKKREITIGGKSITFTNKIFDHVKVGLAHLFNTHGGNIKHLADVFQSKKDSAKTLFEDKAVKNFVEFLGNFATVENDWEKTLINSLNSTNGFDFKIDFNKLEISAKTSENTYKKVVTFKKDFVDALKKSISTIVKNLLKNNTSATVLAPVIESFLNSTVLKGTWIVKHNVATGFEITKELNK